MFEVVSLTVFLSPVRRSVKTRELTTWLKDTPPTLASPTIHYSYLIPAL